MKPLRMEAEKIQRSSSSSSSSTGDGEETVTARDHRKQGHRTNNCDHNTVMLWWLLTGTTFSPPLPPPVCSSVWLRSEVRVTCIGEQSVHAQEHFRRGNECKRAKFVYVGGKCVRNIGELHLFRCIFVFVTLFNDHISRIVTIKRQSTAKCVEEFQTSWRSFSHIVKIDRR